MCLQNKVNSRHIAFLKVGKQTFVGENSNRSYVRGKVIPSLHAEVDAIHRSSLILDKHWVLPK